MDDCIFCKIIKGEIPSKKIYEDDEILAFHDINPAAPVHALLIPKKHIEDLMKVETQDKELVANMFLKSKDIAKQIGIAESGFRLINNCGNDAGQEVKHIHFHIIGGTFLGEKIVN